MCNKKLEHIGLKMPYSRWMRMGECDCDLGGAKEGLIDYDEIDILR